MFEIPDWADCAVSNVLDVDDCLRSVQRVVSAMEDTGGVRSVSVCNGHAEVVEAALSASSPFPAITVTRKQFPAFMAEMLGR